MPRICTVESSCADAVRIRVNHPSDARGRKVDHEIVTASISSTAKNKRDSGGNGYEEGPRNNARLLGATPGAKLRILKCRRGSAGRKLEDSAPIVGAAQRGRAIEIAIAALHQPGNWTGALAGRAAKRVQHCEAS